MREIETKILVTNEGLLAPAQVDEVVSAWEQGFLVAFPTETVYGLGANALSADAVVRIFAAKGRPSDNPLIVHVGDISQAVELAGYFPPAASALAEQFWPGPLTIVLPAAAHIPAVTRGGLATVGIRIPSHPTALQLLRQSRLAIAAPSANTSGRPSPVSAQDVWDDLAGLIEYIVYSGRTGIGVESTVVSVGDEGVRVLRPGGVTVEQLAEVADVTIDPGALGDAPVVGPAASPGMKYRHYAPKAPAVLVEGSNPGAVEEKVMDLALTLAADGQTIGVLACTETCNLLRGHNTENLIMVPTGPRKDMAAIAANIYHCLRELDRSGVDHIVIEGVPPTGMGLAVANRLRKAAGYQLVRADS